LGSYLESDLVTVEELRPYIGYWIDDIAASTDDPKDAAWTACLLTYIHFYGYQGVQALFVRFGYKIQIDQPLFKAFLDSMKDDVLVRMLRTAIEPARQR